MLSQVDRVRSTVRNKCIHPSASTYQIRAEWLPCALHRPRPWGVLLNKKCLTIFLGMSSHCLHSISAQSSRPQLHLIRSSVRKLCQWIRSFLLERIREVHPTHPGCTTKALRPWVALYKGKNLTKQISTFSVCFPRQFLFSWQVNCQEEIKHPPKRMKILAIYLVCLFMELASPGQVVTFAIKGITPHAHDLIGPLQHRTKILVAAHRQQAENGASGVICPFSHNALWVLLNRESCSLANLAMVPPQNPGLHGWVHVETELISILSSLRVCLW